MLQDQIMDNLKNAAIALSLPPVEDLRTKLTRNINGPPWGLRKTMDLQGLVFHQELGWGTVEDVARYHTSAESHLHAGGVQSIAYSFAIRRTGQLVLCNDLDKATWSQGYLGRAGDENAEFMSVMFEGMFKGTGVNDVSAGEPTGEQILAGLVLWKLCKKLWKWHDNALFGHLHFGKPACPGATLGTIISAVRSNFIPIFDFTKTKDRQQALKNLGYEIHPDGIWGISSKGFLAKFQADNGLAADGIWGPKTEAKINEKLEII